jgi:hypothetical protein
MIFFRYGWMPGSKDIPQDIQDQYNWVFPASITHMEILHAAYRSNNPNAAFFIRDPGFIDDIPLEMQPAFIDKFALSKASLKVSTDIIKCFVIRHRRYYQEGERSVVGGQLGYLCLNFHR